ncbi:killer cell lectin-like receptor subfamily F member 1 isoform X3 [Pteropus medius]|uniref:Killer cell lectin-like receptor subfamily F member 1 n=1 Tax=Pteropus vampyrus TaxID=132908 RepID=A0A6P3QPT7_PTEVA|nr:killer cell lectin-like receptor subfamily F member 1 [Pteropus vampyrus]XP_039730223.1 killer cell lectin-like receptor subfamily F member 1 isoform X3 [Pteropus giganteus]
MQEEERYMTLNLQLKKRSSIQTSQLKFKDCSVMLHWYKIFLGVSGIVNAILVLTLLSLTLLGLCPSEWLKYQEKCYWFSNELKSWSDSYGYCLGRKSHLLIVQDQLEMAFIQKNLKQSNYVWIGLNFTSQKKTWTWVDSSPLDSKIFFIKGPATENSCAAIKENKIYSETCGSVFKWVCQY